MFCEMARVKTEITTPLVARVNADNYSAGMQAELDALESKLAQILERYQSVREENLRLRQQMVAMEDANKQLSDRLSEARSRMESLLNKIPD
jgi:predicted nuclease with TOPRIM domain